MFARIFFLTIGLSYFANFLPAAAQVDDSQIVDAMNTVVRDVLHERREQEYKSKLDPLSLTRSKTVRAELELVDAQTRELARIQQKFEQEQKLLSETFLEQMRLLEKTGQPLDSELAKAASQKVHALKEETRIQKEKVLLPHQIQRLNQIAFQLHIRDAGDGEAIVHAESIKSLGISDEQKSRIIQRSVEISTRLEEEIRKLKEEAREELLAELTARQRKKLSELTGEQLDLGDQFKKRRIPKDF